MALFFAGGITGICGNQTEQQGGCVLGASIEQGISAEAFQNGSDIIHIESEGFAPFDIDIGDTEARAEEALTPAALVRGIADCFIENGNIFGGFDAKITSDIPGGSGLSSSAAFEVLIGKIISGLYFENTVPPLRIAQFGQRAENDYYGKPCGLANQLICAVGGTVLADFSDPEMPFCGRIDFDFSESEYSVAVIDCGIGQEDFAEDHSAIAREMGFVAWNMGYTRLCEGNELEFLAQYPILLRKCGERPVLRALHYYEETRRVNEEAEALENRDMKSFIEIYKASAESSEKHLQNIVSVADPERHLEKAIFAAREVLEPNGGAARVHGGGFGGTAQAIVPKVFEAEFAAEMEKRGFGVMFVI